MRRSPEKAVEKAGDVLMSAFGFTAVRFSQARATQQTPGIPDRRYYATHGLAHERQCPPVWWEAKALNGKQTHAQQLFEWYTLGYEEYVCGGVEVLEEFLIKHAVARRNCGGIDGIRVRHSA